MRQTSVFSLLSLLLSLQSRAAPVADDPFQNLKRLALEKSYELKMADESAAQAAAEKNTAWTRLVPRLDLQLIQSRSRDFSILTSGSLGSLSNVFNIVPQANSLSRWEINLSMPLYRRSVWVGVDQASVGQNLAEIRSKLRRTELDWRLRSLLGDYLFKKYREAALQNSIQIARKNLREAELRFELGQKTKVDVLKGKANVSSLDSRRLLYEQERQAALRAFLEYAGLTEADFLNSGFEAGLKTEENLAERIDQFSATGEVYPSIRKFVEPTSADTDLETQIVSSSAVYSSFLAEERSGLSRARSLTAQEWPELSLRGSVNKQAEDWTTALTSENYSYSAAIVLAIPIFSGGSLFSSLAEQRHSQAASEVKSERDLLHFKNEIENDRAQIRALLASLEAQKLTLEQNDELVRLSFKSYQLGKATILELLVSQNDLIDSKAALAKTKIDLSVLMRKFSWNIGVPTP